MLADDLMRFRMGASPLLDVWRACVRGEYTYTSRDRELIASFIEPTFGAPSVPGSDDHVQGQVAELLWDRVAAENPTLGGRRLVDLAKRSWSVTQAGGDGLVVYAVDSGRLVFRLWEIKKHDATHHLSRTTRRACKQLSANAMKYLAQFTAAARIWVSSASFYARLGELWVDRDPRAGVGVSVATSVRHAARDRVDAAFAPLSSSFPRLTEPDQHDGMIVIIDDFPELAERVRKLLWTGL